MTLIKSALLILVGTSLILSLRSVWFTQIARPTIERNYIFGHGSGQHFLPALHDLKVLLSEVEKQANSIAENKFHDLYTIERMVDEIMNRTLSGYETNAGAQEFFSSRAAEKALNRGLTIVINAVRESEEYFQRNLPQILSRIGEIYSNINVVVGTEKRTMDLGKTEEYNIRLKRVNFNDVDSKFGSFWKQLLSGIKTEYVLIVPSNLAYFNGTDEKLGKMVRTAKRLGVDIVGGSSRDQFGHWRMNCFQGEIKNYNFELKEGYDASSGECILCDVVTGPFVARTSAIRHSTADAYADSEITFQDYFVRRIKSRLISVVCPDSMFYVESRNTSVPSWKMLANVHHFVTMKVPNMKNVLEHSCNELGLSCKKIKTLAMPPCCLSKLKAAIKTVMKVCESNNITCEFVEGTALGAVKFNSALPWEVDADIAFNTLAFKRMLGALQQAHKSISVAHRPRLKNGTMVGGYLVYLLKDMFVEVLGRPPLDSKSMIEEGIRPTTVLFDDVWMNTARNPGLYVRNRYGSEVYRHADHWRSLGLEHGQTSYQSGRFRRCIDSGNAGCLEFFNGDGNVL